MPAYNAAGTIRASIDSLINQSFNDWELLVIDDCSSDDTVKEVEKLIEETSGYDIRLIKNEENRGVAYSRNHGIELSNGEWIAFLDSDDMWERDKLEKQIKHAKELALNEGLIFTGSSFISKDNRRLDYILHVPEMIDRKSLLKQNLISCSSVLVSRKLIMKYKFPEGIKTIHEDFAVWLDVLREIKIAYGIDEPLLIYRIASDSKSGKKSKAAVMNWNTYKYVGLSAIERVYYMLHYIINGIMKWGQIGRAEKWE
ncbi:glycosyltransferase family A protein [Oribacterium sp. C9]|uniref:glycosyltransferase family 2 protein n=1 Tax=Oribacterium sp. C9 TaxID=1943579 RepID=UPI001FA9197B